jgi:peptide deformylase
MAIREILLLGNPFLWRSTIPVDDPATVECREMVRDLGETLADFRLRHGFGRAIAAPQIGLPKRIIFVNMNDGTFGPAPLINPRIVQASEEMMELWDDCFSFPDLLVRVARHREIEVEYQDLKSGTCRLTARDDLAELLQHEIDHLDGILATDRAIDQRALAIRAAIRSGSTDVTPCQVPIAGNRSMPGH